MQIGWFLRLLRSAWTLTTCAHVATSTRPHAGAPMQPDLGCGFGLFFWPPPLGYKLPECMQGFLFFFF